MVRTRLVVVAVVGSTLSWVAGGPALSDDLAVEDPTGDGSGSVDVVAASHGHGTAASGPQFGADVGGSVLVHEIEAADEWELPADAVELRITSRRWDVPRRLFVRANPDGSLTGMVFAGDVFRGYANVYRTSPTRLRVELPESVLGRDVRAYRWRVFGTGRAGDGCGDADCSLPPPDRVPDAGSVRHGGLWRFRP